MTYTTRWRRNSAIRSVDRYSRSMTAARCVHVRMTEQVCPAGRPAFRWTEPCAPRESVSYTPNPASRGVISHVECQQMTIASENMAVTTNVNPMYPPGWSSPTVASTMPPTSGISVPEAVARNSLTVDSVVRSLKSVVISPGSVLYDVPNSCASMTHTT